MNCQYPRQITVMHSTIRKTLEPLARQQILSSAHPYTARFRARTVIRLDKTAQKTILSRMSLSRTALIP